MNVLFLCLSFSTKTHKNFYEDLLHEFIRDGHQVYVACAKEKRHSEQVGLEELNGISVLRIKTGNITETQNLLEKGLSTLLVDGQFQRAIKKYYGNIKFDLILYPTPPITLANTVATVKKKTGAVTYLLLKDIFPQNAVDLGMLRTSGLKGLIHRYFRHKERCFYRVSDYIGCMSPANVSYLLKHNTDIVEGKAEVCPNCERPLDTNELTPSEISAIREKYGIPPHKKVFVYGGNLGKPQGIKFFLDCLRACGTVDQAFFLVVGGGSEAPAIEKTIAENNIVNAKLLATLPKKDYECLVNSCDVGMIFLDHRFTIPNFPSRILSYMQYAKPVVVAADPNTDMGTIVEENGFGWKCLSNDTNAFASCVQKALGSDLAAMGIKGREYLIKNYTTEIAYHIIMKHFDKENK